MKVALLFVVLVIVFTEATSSATSESPSSTSCESLLRVCKKDLLDLLRQRERVKASRKKLEFQQWRLRIQKKELDNEIILLTHQLNNPDPDAPVALVPMDEYGMEQWIEPAEPRISDLEPCATRIRLCEESTERVLNLKRCHEETCATLRSDIAQKTQVNEELRVTAGSLKQQLARRGVTPIPSSQVRISENMQSSKEFDVDSTEIERRVA